MTEHLTEEQLSSLIDGELSLAARETASAHLRGCPRCAGRHDALVEAVSALRLEQPLPWQERDTRRVLARITRTQRRELALPLALASAALAGLLGALELEAVRAAVAIAASTLGAAGAFLPSALGGGPSGTLAAVLAVAVLAPLLSLRLAR